MAPHGVPRLPLLGTSECKRLPSRRSVPCLHVSPYLTETNPRLILEQPGVTIGDPTHLLPRPFLLFPFPKLLGFRYFGPDADRPRPLQYLLLTTEWVRHQTAHPARRQDKRPQQRRLWNTAAPLRASGTAIPAQTGHVKRFTESPLICWRRQRQLTPLPPLPRHPGVPTQGLKASRC